MKLSEVSVGQRVFVRSVWCRFGPVVGTVEYVHPEAPVRVLVAVSLGPGRATLSAVRPEELDPVLLLHGR